MRVVYSQSNPPPKRKVTFDKNDGMTKQSFKDTCDINAIVAKAVRSGMLPENGNPNPIYGDFSSVKDYQEGLNVILKAEAQFNSLPAMIRSQFQNDPAQFLEFATDPKNKDELVKMGLAKRAPAPPRTTEDAPKAPPKPDATGVGGA